MKYQLIMAYVDTHPLRSAFVANPLRRLVELISNQGETLLQDAGLEFPSRTISCVLLIGERGEISAADIAKTLSQPHQLVTQRIDLLIKLGVVERLADPADKRRKILALTPKGVIQFECLKPLLAEADIAFTALFAEINCDLPTIALRMLDALTATPILDRVKAPKPILAKADSPIMKRVQK